MSHCLGSFYTHLSKKCAYCIYFYSTREIEGIFLQFFTIKFLQSHAQRLLFFGQDYLITIIIIFTII